MGGEPATIESVIPVSTAMNGGITWCGLTSVWNSPSTSPPRTFTAPTSVIIDPPCAEPPVVSRSTTQNVTSCSGRPRSSKLRWDSHREPAEVAAGGVTVLLMVRTVWVTTDQIGSPRGIPWEQWCVTAPELRRTPWLFRCPMPRRAGAAAGAAT